MKQKIQKVKGLSLRVRLLLGLLLALGIAVPTAWAASNFVDYNYIIYPPADQNTYLGANGPRLQQLIHSDVSGAGSSAAYFPDQYLVASSVPKLTFEMRGGYWEQRGESRRDYYDRVNGPPRFGGDANPGWVVDFMKKQGYLSPVYYEVYQLTGDNPGNGTLLGVINPRLGNIFPYPDDNPTADSCYGGGCWRQFSIDGGGGAITTDGGAQDSCQNRSGGSNNQIKCGYRLSYNIRRDNNQQHGHGGPYGQDINNNASDNFPGSHSHHNPNNSGGDSSQLNHCIDTASQNCRDQYNTSPNNYQQSGKCFWDWLSHDPELNPGAPYRDDNQHTHSVWCLDTIVNTAPPQDAFASGSRFGGVQDWRFGSSSQPNLNGNYVFLVKAVAYSDIGRGYAPFDRFKLQEPDRACPEAYVGCPNSLLTEAVSHPERFLVQNGYYLRVPKYQNSFFDRQFIATAPTTIAFGINYGPAPAPQSEGHYEGLKFSGGGSACRAASAWPLTIPTADWDGPGFFGSGSGFDQNIQAFIGRYNTLNDRGQLGGAPSPYEQQVISSSISGDWFTSSGTNNIANHMNINYPGRPPGGAASFFSPPWQNLETGQGTLRISQWDDGNELLQGGQPFTTGFWPTCRPPNPQPLTPKSVDSGYKYDGQDSYTPVGSDVDARLNFNFQYNLPEFRPQVDWRVDIATDSGFSGIVLQSSGTDTNVEAPGGKSAPINTNSLLAKTDYYWRGCINDQVNGDRCTTPTIKFRINKGPTSQAVSADPANPTDSGNVNYNCSRLAVILTDPEGDQVRPYFTVSWTDSSGQLNRVESFDRSLGISDNWSSWVTGNGYKASGSTFTSDEMRPMTWTVNGVSRSVPNKTLTQFLQQDVPESSNVTWNGRGEDSFGASDLNYFLPWGTSLTPPPLATNNAGYAADQQSPLNNRRFGAPVATNYHKNTRPNLNTASTKKFNDFSGTPVTSVTDGQTVQVETTLVNGGETPTKSYQIADYIGSIRDFEPPITTDPTHPITVQYNGGTKTTVSPAVSAVIPNHQNGNLDQPENAASTNDDRQASYKLNFGANPIQGGSSVAKNGNQYSSSSCQQSGSSCLTDPSYPNGLYWLGMPAWATYSMSPTTAGTYDLTLSYFNGLSTDQVCATGTDGKTNACTNQMNPPPGYSYNVTVAYPGGSQTVNLPIESDSRSHNLHSYTINNLNITGANPSVTVTWNNDSWTPGVYDANFGLDSLRLNPVNNGGSILRPGELAPGESITLDYYIRADRNHDTITNQNLQNSDQNQNFQRRLGVGSTASPQPAPSADPNGGTIDIGDAHTFVPFSEDYCNTNNPLINHTCEFKPGDVLAPFLRTQRGSVASNGGVFGYDALAGTSNATFLVQANGVLSHFTSQTGTLPNYTSQQAVCTAQGERPGGVDWRRTMIANINKLNGGTKNATHANTGPLLNPGLGQPRGKLDGTGGGRNGNVWVVGSPSVPEDLTIDNPIQFSGVGTILVFGDLTIGPGADLTYAPDTNGVNSLGVIVVGNLTIDPTVTNLVGSYYVLDSQPSVDANGCPVGIDPAKTTRGLISTGSSSTRLNVQGLLVAGKFDFLRYFTNPSDSEADPAENVYYDGRVLANTPPGFGTFRNTASWYEIAP